MAAMRSAALRLPLRSSLSVRPSLALRPVVGRATLADAVKLHPEDVEQIAELHTPTAKAVPLQDPRIPHGVQAFVVEPQGPLPDNEFNRSRQAVFDHASQTTDLWRKISYYIAIPACVVTAIWVYYGEKEHAEHRQHLIDENGGELPERKVYSYMNIRTKPFPWGHQSLFFNPEYNIPIDEPSKE